MNTGGTAVSEAEILAHAIETLDKTNWKQVAQVVSQLKLPKEPERAELERYLPVGNFLDLMKARALRELGQTPGS